MDKDCYDAWQGWVEKETGPDGGPEGLESDTGDPQDLAEKGFLAGWLAKETITKKNYTVDAWVGGYSTGARQGFCRGKWAGYTQALAKVLELIPSWHLPLRSKIQALFNAALTTGKTT